MTEKKQENQPKKAYGLVLDLGGAPNSPHEVPNVYGTFRPDRPTPVGGPGEPTLAQARELSANEGVHLKLVEINPGDVQSLRAAAAADRMAHSRGVTE